MRINYSTKLKYNFKDLLPGTSAELAAIVTDKTGSPGSLVFSGNPTLQGVTVDGIAYVGDTTPTAGLTLLGAMFSTDIGSGNNVVFRKCNNGINTPNFTFAKGRGTAASPSAVQANDGLGAINFYGYDGTNYIQAGYLVSYVDGTVSTGIVPSRVSINVNNSAGSSTEAFAISSAQVVTLGGISTAPALKVIPAANQARWIEIIGAASSGNPTLGVSGGKLAISSQIILSQTTLVETSVALTNGAAAAAGTLLNAPAAGDPTKWIPINDNGTTRYIPAW